MSNESKYHKKTELINKYFDLSDKRKGGRGFECVIERYFINTFEIKDFRNLSKFKKIEANFKIFYSFEAIELDPTTSKEKIIELEKIILNSTIEIYQNNIEVISLSLTKELKEWKILEDEIRNSGNTIDGRFIFTPESRNSYVFFKNDKLQVYLTSFEKLIEFDVFKMLNKHKNLMKITFSKRNLNGVVLSLKRQELILLCQTLLKELPALENICDIEVSGTNYTFCEPGAQLYENIIKKREKKRIRFLIKNGRKAKYNKSKVMFLGSGGVGKTSTLRSLLGKPFIKKHISTNVAKCDTNVFCDINLDKWTEVLNHQQSFFSNDLKTLSRDVVEDKVEGVINVKKTENYQNYDFHNEGPKGRTREKKSLKTKNIDTQLQKSEEDTNISSKKLSVWDFGGQEVFDVLHPLYLTSEGLCILVFNLRNLCQVKQVKEKELNQIKMWLYSLNIYTQECKVFLVGTRCEDATVRRIGVEKINEELEVIFSSFDFIKYVENEKCGLLFFPVENSIGKNNENYLRPLKKRIIETLETKEDIVSTYNSKIPLAWMMFMNNVCKDGKNLTNQQELIVEGIVIGFRAEEMKSLLNFFSKAGAILNFEELLDESNDSDILDNVVLRPLFLLQALGSFIYDETLHDDTIRKIGRKKKQGLWALSLAYMDSGVLGSAMLDTVFKYFGIKERESQFLKVLCQRMLIFSKLSSPPESLKLSEQHIEMNEEFYLVPGMNKKSCNSEEIDSLIKEEQTEGFMKWKINIPQGLYERVICSFLSHARDFEDFELSFLSKRFSVFEIRCVKVCLKYVEKNHFAVLLNSKNESAVQQIFDIMVKVNEELKSLKFCKMTDAKIKLGNAKVRITKLEVQEIDLIEGITSHDWVYDCFLSHSWGRGNETHKRVVEFASCLKKQGFKVWVDENDLNESVSEDIVRGIDRSAAFVAFLTKDYMTKTGNRDSNAGKEFNYISRRGAKFIIPVVLDAQLLNPSNWQGTVAALQLGNALYIDFSTEAKVKNNWQDFCKRIKSVKENKRKMNLFSLSERVLDETILPLRRVVKKKKRFYFF